MNAAAPVEEPEMPRELDIDPATVTRLDGREEFDPFRGIVWQRMTIGTAPDGTPVLISEAPRPGTRLDDPGQVPLAKVWAYDSLDAARQDRDEQISRGYLPGDAAEHIRDVSASPPQEGPPR